VRKDSLTASLVEAIKGRRVRRLGFQKNHVSVGGRERLAKEISERRLRPAAGLISALRVTKGPEELRLMRKAVRIAQQGFAELIAGGAKGLVGRTERQIAAELDYRMRLAGADGPAFQTIVASGPNGSKCHYRPADRRARRGEALLVDWGANVAGYCSDLTRVLFLSRIPPELAEVYEVVRRAQAAAIAACRPGVACKTPDAAARKVIESAGHGKEFVHGLGHGVGREVHEAPGLARGSKTRLRAGMVVTVEPGIYLPGVGGVRIEDDVLITSSGSRRLSSVPRALDRAVLR
jgi:Xaa-Pro aminopeptidase